MFNHYQNTAVKEVDVKKEIEISNKKKEAEIIKQFEIKYEKNNINNNFNNDCCFWFYTNNW